MDTHHLDCDAQDGFQVELSATLLEKVFQTLAKKIHNHYMISFVIVSFFITNKMEVRYTCYIMLI